MITEDLEKERQSLDEALALAKPDSVLIHTGDGMDFLLKEANELERQVAMLGRSHKFMALLEKRAMERDEVSASEIADRLGMEPRT